MERDPNQPDEPVPDDEPSDDAGRPVEPGDEKRPAPEPGGGEEG